MLIGHNNSPNDKTSIVDLVENFKNLRGWKLFFEVVKWVFTGVFMGSSDAIPGYSGGTTLALVGFFKRLIFISKSIFVPEPGIKRTTAILFMLPFSIGWVAGIFGIAKLTEMLAEQGLGLELILFFSCFVAFGIPTFLRGNNPGLRKNEKKRHIRLIFLGLGFTVILTIALIVRFVMGGAPFHGVEAENGLFNLEGKWWLLIIVAYFGGAITLMPGGSGALFQLLVGFYPEIHWKIMAHVTAGWQNGVGLMVFAISTLLGMVTMIFAFAWLMKYHEKTLTSTSLGMLFASIFAICIVIKFGDGWEHIETWYHAIGAIASGALGGGLAYTINYYVKKRIKRDNAIHEARIKVEADET